MDRWLAPRIRALLLSTRVGYGIPAVATVVLLLSGTEVAAAQTTVEQVRSVGLSSVFDVLVGGAYAVGVDASTLAPQRMPADSRPFDADWILPSLAARVGLDPVTLGALAEYSGRSVPRETRRRWLQQIADADGQRGVGAADLTLLSVRRGRYGVRWTTSARSFARLNRDAAEAVLFGNVGLTGEPREFEFSDSELAGWTASSVWVGTGARLDEVGAGDWGAGTTVGLAAHWTIGHTLVTGRDAGSTVSTDPVTLNGIFPIVQTSGGSRSGNGWGIDAAIRTRRGPWTLVLQANNVFADFAWSTQSLTYRPGVALLGPDSAETNSPRLPFAGAPESVRTRVESFAFGRILRVAGAYSLRPTVRLTSALSCRRGVRDGVGPDGCQVGGGVERTWTNRFRGSVGAMAGSSSVTGGFGGTVRLGRVLLDFSAFQRFGEEPQSGAAIGFALGTTRRSARSNP